MSARRAAWGVGVVAITLLLLLGTLTPALSSVSRVLPDRFDLILHFILHAVLSLMLLRAIPTLAPAGACGTSAVLALAVEGLQALQKRGRTASAADAAAGVVGASAAFVQSVDVAAMRRWLLGGNAGGMDEDDEDEEDGHRVGSWAV